jgi:hypothetical protein
MQLGEFRQQYPQYNAWSDADLAEALYQKYYSDRDRNEFYSTIGVPLAEAPEAPQEPDEEAGILEQAYDAAGDLFAGLGSAFTMMPVSAVKGTGTVFGADVEGEFVSDLSETERNIQEFFGGDPSTVPYKFGSALGSMLSFVGTTVATGLAAPALGIGAGAAAGASLLARAAPLAVRYGPAALMGAGAGASEQVDRLRALGDKLGDVDEIDRRLAILSGYGVGTSEVFSLRWPVGLLLSALKKETPKALVNKYVQTLIAAGAEGTQEAAAQIAQNAIAKGFYDPDLDITESAAENFGYGAAAAGVLHGVLALALPRTRRISKEQEDAEAAAEAETAPVEQPVLAITDQSAPVLLLEDLRPESETTAAPEEDGVAVAEKIVGDLGGDLVLSFNRGVITTDADGNPDAYEVEQDERGRLFVQNKNGLRVSPYLSTRQQAETVRSELNFRIPEILERQDRMETEALAQESVRAAKEEDRGTLLEAARVTVRSPTVRFDELTDDEAVRINSRRANTQRQQFTEDDFLTVTELSDQGLGSERIEELLPATPRTFSEDEKLGLLSSLEGKGFSSEGAGFDRFARRKTGTSDLDEMGNAQLGMLETAIEELPSFPAGELRSLPVIQEPEFNGQQYATAINTARMMPARSHNNNGTPRKNPLEEGEVLKSDINKSLGIRGGLTESILQEAVKRGDLVPSARVEGAYIATDKYQRPSEYTIARQVEGGPRGPVRSRIREEDIEGLRPLERGELIEQEARDAAAVEPTVPFVGEGIRIKIRRAETDGTPMSLAEATDAFKAKIDRATVREEVRANFPNLGGFDGVLASLTKRLSKVKGLESSPVALELVRALDGGQEGVFNSAKMTIAVALDAIRDPKGTKEDAMKNLEQVLDHETIHALKRVGLFTDAEWRTLTNYVKKAGPASNLTYYEEVRNEPVYQGEVDRLGLSPEAAEDYYVEEAIANAFSDFGRNETIYVNGKPQKITGKPRNLLDRIVDFFRRLRGGLGDMDIQSANQVFAGLREPQTGPAAPAPGATAEEQALAEASATATGQARADAPAETFTPVESYAVRRLGRDSASVETAPDEIKGSTIGEDEDAEWKKLRPSRTKAGKILGAPSWVKTSSDMVRLRKLIAQLVNEGESGRFWYEDSARTALEIAGGNLADAERFIGLLAIYSPQSGVFANTGFAIKAFTQWENGEPVNVKTADQDGKAQRWLDRGEDWGGRKTNSFYLNIMHDIVNNASQAELDQLNLPPELLQEVKRATVDLWVLRAFGYDVDQAGTQDKGSGKYSFSEDELRRMASVLNGKLKDGERRWLPHQVQAALWSAIKGRAEIPSVKERTNEQSLKRGFATIGDDGKISPPQTLGPARAGHMKIWRRNALQASPQEAINSIESARGSFKDMVERIAQNVTWEAIPSASLGTSIYEASDVDQRDFTEEAVELLLDESGIDLLAKFLGVSLGSLRESTGAYAAQIGPNVITGLVPIKPKGAFDNKLAYAYARAIQYIFRQDAVPIFRADPKIKFDNSYKIVSPKTGKTVRAVGTYGEAVDILQEYIQREAEKEARVERVEARKKATAERAGKPYKRKSYSPVQYFVRGDDAAQGIQFVFDAPLTRTREKQFFSALRRVYGRDVGYTKVSPDRIALVNYRSGEMDGVPWDGGRVAENIPFLMPDDRLLSLAAEFDPRQGGAAADRLGIREVTTFGSIGEYGPVHDWATDPDGKELLDERSETRRSDLQSWLRNRREAAEELTRRYERAERDRRGPAELYAVRRSGRLGPPVEDRAARERERLRRERAAAPSFEEAKRIREKLRSGDIQTGDYRNRLQEGAINPVFLSPTPLAWEGKDHRVIIQRGHNEFNDLKQGYNGFGLRHAKVHLTDIQQNTPFDSVESFVEGTLSAYRNSRNTPEAANFDMRESGAHFVLRWDNPSWPYPATLVFKEASFNRFEKLIDKYPNLIDETFFSLTTSFALPADKGAVEPRILPQVNPGASVTAKRAAGEAKPNERISPALREQYSVRRRSRENYQSSEQRDFYDRHFDSGPNETFFEKIMRGTALNSEEHIGSRFRYYLVDRYEAWKAAEKLTLAKGLIDKITAESSTSAAFAAFTRATGIVSAALTQGFVIYNRGFFHTINLEVLDSIDPRIAEEYRKEYRQLVSDTAYRDVVTGEDVRLDQIGETGKWGSPQGLVQILQEVDNLGLMEQFSAYAGAVRARRLKSEGRERLFSERDIEIGLQLGVQHPEIRLAHQRYQLWNNSIVNLMVKSGVISQQMGELWKSNSDYLPFYREFYADEGVAYQVLSPEGEGAGAKDVPLRETLFESLDNNNNNKFFPSFQNLKQPKELKGGKPVYRLMVGDVADSRAYIDRNSQALKNRLEELQDLNRETGRRVYITASTQRIRDPISNMLMNASSAITSSMLNVAVSRGIRDLRLLGDTMARPLTEEQAPDSTTGPQSDKIGIRVNGETKWYWVGDRMLIDSLVATNDIDMPFLGLQALPAQLLRELITKDPGFMVANMLRDTLSAWTTSGVNITPVVGTLRGFGEALMGTTSAAALTGAGVVGGYDFKGDTSSVFKAFKKHQKEGRRIRLRDAPSRLWRAWDKFAGASDTSTRIAVYKRVLEETGNEAQAITEALEVINFSRKGASPAMRYMTAIIPFLNARVQGLDVLHRGMKGEVTTWDRQARKSRFYWRAATMVALTTGYYLAHAHSDEEDDPWYHNAPEYIKDNYWIIPPTWVGMSKNAPAVRIPIPFEVGVMFKVIPERIIRLIDGSSDGRETWDALIRHGGTTLNFNPTPQWALPVLEGVMNYSFFRSRPVVGYWQGKNEGWLADPTFTSPFAIMLSEAVDKAGGRLSAQKVDHVFRGYVGTLGSYALMAADSVGRVAAGLPERESRRLDQWPVLGRFLQESQGRGPVQTFYDLYQELDIFVSSLNRLKKSGDVAGEDYLVRSRANLEANAAYIESLKKQLDEMRLFRQQVKQDRSATPLQKREALDEIDRMSNEIVQGVRKLRTQALTRQ